MPSPSKRQIEKFVTFNLREIYHEFGKYDFKVVLSPRFFKNSHMSDVSIVDCAGKQLPVDVKKWGRKINCGFSVDDSVAEGVCTVSLYLRDDQRDHTVHSLLKFWFIKP